MWEVGDGDGGCMLWVLGYVNEIGFDEVLRRILEDGRVV